MDKMELLDVKFKVVEACKFISDTRRNKLDKNTAEIISRILVDVTMLLHLLEEKIQQLRQQEIGKND